MDIRLKIETARDRLIDQQDGFAQSLEGAKLPVETAAFLASAQHRLAEAITDIDRSLRYLAFDGAVQRIVASRAVVDGKTGALVA